MSWLKKGKHAVIADDDTIHRSEFSQEEFLDLVFEGIDKSSTDVMDMSSVPLFQDGELVWIPRINSPGTIIAMEEAKDSPGGLSLGFWNYHVVSIKGPQWISEEYLQKYELRPENSGQ